MSYTPSFVYLVSENESDGYTYSSINPLAVFSSRDLAEIYILKLCEAYEKLYPQLERSPDYYDIEEYDLDNPDPPESHI